MERPDPDARSWHKGLDPFAHLAGRLVGECQGEDGFRRDAGVEEMGHSAGDDPRLAGTGPGKDQDRAVDVRHRLALGNRQISEQVHR